jgi:hypothetical protein
MSACGLRGRGGLARAGAGEAVEHGAGQPVAAGDLQRVDGAVRAERPHPGGDGAAHGRRRLRAADLRDLHAPGLEGHEILALGRFFLGLDDQLDGALEPRRRLEHAGGEAEDRAHVDVLARPRRAPRPVIAPAGERAQHRDELARALGQLVVHARRHLAVALAREQAVGHHAVQPRAQLLGGDAGQDALELDEPARSGGKIADDEERPLVAHEVQGPGVRRPLVVGMTLGWRDRWDRRAPLG